MAHQYLVRISVLGHVGRFRSADSTCFQRGQRVICRTRRGLEVGEVLAPVAARPLPDDAAAETADTDGTLLRRVTVEDDLLIARLEHNKDEAYQACSSMLRERGSHAVLMDVEQLFDGQSLYFYFLGEVSDELERLTAELAETYESKVQFRQFAESVVAGCGPGCGTDEAAGGGCGSGGCGSCGVASACATRRRA